MQRSNSRRAVQMGDQIMQVLASLLVQEVEDPTLQLVTITGVRLNRDFSIAEVLYTHIRGRSAEPEITKALTRAKGFLQVASSPLTRSSYHAGDDFERMRAAREEQLARDARPGRVGAD